MIIIWANGNKYDVEKLLDNHPGGNQCIIKKQNTDCTVDYKFHSQKGRNEWKHYLVTDEKSCDEASSMWSKVVNMVRSIS